MSSNLRALKRQATHNLESKMFPGHSRHQDKILGLDAGRIYSYSSYQLYKRIVMAFLKDYSVIDPDCTSLRQARPYVSVWLQSRVDRGLSPCTIATDRSALGKLYGIRSDDPEFFVGCPVRHRADITRSRGPKPSDRHFSVAHNQDLINFCRGCGLRRHVLVALSSDDLWVRKDICSELHRLRKMRSRTCEENCRLSALRYALDTPYGYFVHVRKGKGGRERFAPIIGPYAGAIVSRFRSAFPGEKIWPKVHSNADIHSFRADYAMMLYTIHARPVEDIDNASEVYTCRSDLKGIKLDKAAMMLVSHALGHNRICVFAQSYFRRDWSL